MREGNTSKDVVRRKRLEGTKGTRAQLSTLNLKLKTMQ